MIQSCEIIEFIIFPFLVSAIIFIMIMISLKRSNFKDGNRKDNWRDLTPELLSEQIAYHNNATYRAFEFYIKMILAILGGISFVAVTNDKNIENLKIIIQTGGLIIYPVTLLLYWLIINHQRAKIERWRKPFKWEEIFMWNEFWFVTIPVPIAFALNEIIIPQLLKNL